MVIIAYKGGGQLGNRLFLFAIFIAFCKEHNLKLYNPSFNEYGEYFENTKDNLVSCYPKKHKSISTSKLLKKIIYKISFHTALLIAKIKIRNKIISTQSIGYMERMDLEQATNAALFTSIFSFAQGWLFSAPGLLHKHRDSIIDYFIPIKKHNDNITNLIQKIKKNADIIIGVHIRHGDYSSFEGGKYFYSLEVYAKIMKNLLKFFRNKKVTFLVCSNEKQDISIFDELNIVIGTNHLIEDMYSFTKCDYIIGPPSTFTMWASFYGSVPLYIMDTASDHPNSLEEFKIITS